MTDRERRLLTRFEAGELTQEELDAINFEFGDHERDCEIDREPTELPGLEDL
jgi:hypothetical protein